MYDFQRDFIEYALACEVLKFGEFKLKSGRISPYFFNTGLFNTGRKLARLGKFYVQALLQSGIKPDILYGPAYKGISLVCTVAIAYNQITDSDIPFVFNRKEAKDHGEGGNLVGAPLSGNALILDDVITAGTSVRESVEIITNTGASPCGVLIALDRQETGRNGRSAIKEVEQQFEMPVCAIINLDNIIEYIKHSDEYSNKLEAISQYKQQYGIIKV